MPGDVSALPRVGGSGRPADPRGRRGAIRHPGRVAVVVVGILAVVNLLAYAGLRSDTGSDPARPVPHAVRRIQPAPDSLVTPQEGIQVTLADGMTGVLAVDGRPVPLDQITFTGPSDLSFRPGPGREWTRWGAGLHRAAVTYWPETEGRSHARTFTWTFRVGA